MVCVCVGCGVGGLGVCVCVGGTQQHTAAASCISMSAAAALAFLALGFVFLGAGVVSLASTARQNGQVHDPASCCSYPGYFLTHCLWKSRPQVGLMQLTVLGAVGWIPFSHVWH